MSLHSRSLKRAAVAVVPLLVLFGFGLKPALATILVLIGLAIVVVPFMPFKPSVVWRYGLWGCAGAVGVALILSDVLGGSSVVQPSAPVVVKTIPAASGSVIWAHGDNLQGFIPSSGNQNTLLTLATGSIVSDFALSPSGNSYALSYAPDTNGLLAGDNLLKLMDLYVLPREGGTPKLLLTHQLAGGGIGHLSWSIDGKYIFAAITVGQGSSTIVRVTRADGSVTKIATDASEPSCTPDGKSLIFVHSQATDGYAEIWRSNLDGSGARAIKGSRFQDVVSPVISPDGKTLAFSAPYIPSAQGQTRSALPWLNPSSVSAHGGNWELWTLPANGGKAEVRTAFAENRPRLVWSPAGGEIAVNADLGLYVVDLAQNRTNLFELNLGSGLVWSP